MRLNPARLSAPFRAAVVAAITEAKPLAVTVAEQLELFNTGGEHRLCFGENNHVQVRSIRRYIANASNDVASKKNPADVEEAEGVRNTQQIIESVLKLWNAWYGKT